MSLDLLPDERLIPDEGSQEFYDKIEVLQRELVHKFAWTAQHNGIIYRHDPASLRPLDDTAFNRISRAGHSFYYRKKGGKLGCFFYRMDQIVSALDDPELDFGFIFAEAVEFLPGEQLVTKDALNRTVLNIWQKPRWRLELNSAEPKYFLDHVEYLFDHDQIAMDHFLNVVSHLVQLPGQRINHALLITSEAKGIGKSTLGTIIRRLTGERNSGVAQSKDLKSQFDGWLIGKLVVQVDEIYEYGNWDLTNKLKPLITEPLVSVNLKYGPQLSVNNFARFIMFSNHTTPLDLEIGDRRFFVFNSQAKPKDAEYYERLNNYIESDRGMTEIYSWLARRDISMFKPFAGPPMTDAKVKLIEASGSPLRRYIKDSLASGHLLANCGREFTLDRLQRLLTKEGYGNHVKNYKEISAALEEAGIAKRRVSKGGQRPRLYFLPEPEGGWKEDDTPF